MEEKYMHIHGGYIYYMGYIYGEYILYIIYVYGDEGLSVFLSSLFSEIGFFTEPETYSFDRNPSVSEIPYFFSSFFQSSACLLVRGRMTCMRVPACMCMLGIQT